MQKITPFIWFDSQAEEAANYYVSVFNNSPVAGEEKSQIISTTRYGKESAEASGMSEGSVMTVEFVLAGMNFVAINGGKYFKLNGAVSFVVNCETQKEVDWYWERLSDDGGKKGVCGWIDHDKFGVTWQVVPTILGKYLQDKDPKKAASVMAAMLNMTKIDIKELSRAYENA